MIPKKIHYCWFGDKELPKEAKKCIESWKKYMSGFEIIRHDESNFDFKKNLYAKEAYDNKKYAFVSDYARLKIIYDEGGIYFDTDVELIKPLNEEMLKNGFFAKEDRRLINTGIGFAAKKGDKIIKKMLNDYENIHFIFGNGNFDKTSCPIRNTRSIKDDIIKKGNLEYVDDKPIYPEEYFAPLSYKTGILKKTKNTYAVHLGVASWLDEKTKNQLKYRHECIKKYGHFFGVFVYVLTKNNR